MLVINGGYVLHEAPDQMTLTAKSPGAVLRKKVPANTVPNSFFFSVELIADFIIVMTSAISSTETKKEFSTVLAGTFFLNTVSGDYGLFQVRALREGMPV